MDYKSLQEYNRAQAAIKRRRKRQGDPHKDSQADVDPIEDEDRTDERMDEREGEDG